MTAIEVVTPKPDEVLAETVTVWTFGTARRGIRWGVGGLHWQGHAAAAKECRVIGRMQKVVTHCIESEVDAAGHGKLCDGVEVVSQASLRTQDTPRSHRTLYFFGMLLEAVSGGVAWAPAVVRVQFHLTLHQA